MSIETAKGAPVSSKPVTLYGFHKQPKSPSGSAFCQKLETYYRFSNIPYIDEGTTPNTAPKGKLPYVKYEDGTFRADSHLIIRHEVEKGGPELDSMCGLTDLEKADGAVYRGYWEDHVVSTSSFSMDLNASSKYHTFPVLNESDFYSIHL